MSSKLIEFCKKKIKFKRSQIPVIVTFLILNVSFFLAFSNCRTSKCETIGRQITRIAETSKNKQLTADFYPDLSSTTIDVGYVNKLVTDTKQYNNKKYLNYRTSGHRVRVISNGEGRKDYWFPELENKFPAFFMDNSFSHSAKEPMLYDNYNVYLLNETNYYDDDRKKFFFINEEDANYLINNNPDFAGLSLKEVPGNTIELHYFKNGIEQYEDWTISNVIKASKTNDKHLEDKIYKDLYGSYVVCFYQLPEITTKNNGYPKFSVAYDFVSNEIDNTNSLSDIITRYGNYKMAIDSRNFVNPDHDALNNIVRGFNNIVSSRNNDRTILLVVIASIAVFSFATVLYFLKFDVPELSSSLGFVFIFFITYVAFMAFSHFLPFSIFDKAFNSYSILSNIFFVVFAIIGVALATLLKSKKKPLKIEMPRGDSDEN